MNRLQSIRGMHDILPDQTPAWRWLERRIQALLEAYGYQELRLPLLEKTELFLRAIGQATDVVEKEMYAFEDRNGESICLRPEGTAGVVRAVLQHGLLGTPGVRLWYSGPMFRHERPQKGRQRQFHQTGVELFGIAEPSGDLELLALGTRLWDSLGISDRIRLEINTLGDREDRARYREKLVEYLRPHAGLLDEDSRRRLDTNPLRIFDSKVAQTRELLADAPRLIDHIGTAAREHFDVLCEGLDRLGIRYVLNPGLVRGLDYYSRSVFEWTTDALGAQGTVCAGGRYDELVEIQGGRPTPAVGFAMGMERILALVEDAGHDFTVRPHAYLVGDDDQSRLVLAEELRGQVPGLRLICDLKGGSFKSQFKRADRSGAALALIWGESERSEDRPLIKFLHADRPQQAVPRAEIAHWLKGFVAETGTQGVDGA